MKEILYRNSILSLIITNIWSILVFFIFYFEEGEFIRGLAALGFYAYSSWTASGLGILIILFRILFFKKEEYKLKFYALFIVAGILNLFFFLIFIVLIILNLAEVDYSLFNTFLVINFIVSLFIFFDISKNFKEINIEKIII